MGHLGIGQTWQEAHISAISSLKKMSWSTNEPLWTRLTRHSPLCPGLKTDKSHDSPRYLNMRLVVIAWAIFFF